MRIVLYTGKGGVGKTCVSAAAALAASRLGHRTIILSSDRAHSLGDCFQVKLGPEPTTVAPGLDALEVAAGAEVSGHWAEIQDYMRSLISSQGVDSLRAEEIALIPGIEEAGTLLRLKDFRDSGEYDAFVVDCAPTGSTLRLLSFPEACAWFMRRIFPIHRRVVGTIRPVAGRIMSLPLPGDNVYVALQGLYERLMEITELLTDPEQTGVRLVTIPERMAVEETKRAFTEFSLYGLCIEQVIANRILPKEVSDPYLAETKASQRAWVERIRADFEPITITEALQLPGELVGLEALGRFADALFGDTDPMAQLLTEQPIRIEETDGMCRMILGLRFAEKGDVELMQRGDELVVEIGSSRRNLLLPRALARMRATSAKIDDGALTIGFEEPPATPTET